MLLQGLSEAKLLGSRQLGEKFGREPEQRPTACPKIAYQGDFILLILLQTKKRSA